jgi:hypothetical protein
LSIRSKVERAGNEGAGVAHPGAYPEGDRRVGRHQRTGKGSLEKRRSASETEQNSADIIGRFVHLEIKEVEEWDGRKTKKEALIFPWSS